jgi:hypothetical protein
MTSSRVNLDGSISTDVDSSTIGDDSEDSRPSMVSRTPSKFGAFDIKDDSNKVRANNMDLSGHSSLGSQKSSHFRTQLSRFASARSVLTTDKEFDEEPQWKTILRQLQIFAPTPDEKPIKRTIRLIMWASLFLDFLAALVSITTYDGVTTCCGQEVLSIAGNIDWNLAIRVTTWVYMIMIFAEIIPVMGGGFPFNLVNPLLGFMITFAVFFDDRILEAVIMWVIEFSAVSCEVAVYLLKLRVHRQREERLTQCEKDLLVFRKQKKKLLIMVRENATYIDPNDDSSGSFDESSFHDESAESADMEAINPKSLTQVRETRLLRERRILRQTQSEDRIHLRYHLIGVALNTGLVVISLLLVILIGKSGGLCIEDMISPNVFKMDQLEKCYDCKGVEGICEICRPDGTSQCYYPYL